MGRRLVEHEHRRLGEERPGDQEPLPTSVVLEGLDFPSSGYYDITNARISSNGSIRIAMDNTTRVRPRARVITQMLESFAGF